VRSQIDDCSNASKNLNDRASISDVYFLHCSESHNIRSIRRRCFIGDASALFELGTKYYSGKGIAQSYAEALHF
jgi:TPR repeat protein